MRGKIGRFTQRAFTPDRFGGLTGWWDASDSSTLFNQTSGGSAVDADGGVARFADKSGNGRHFTQSSSTLRPLRKTSVANGLDAIRFDGLNHRMVMSGFTYQNIQSATAGSIFIVARVSAVIAGLINTNQPSILSEDTLRHGAFTLLSSSEITAWGTDAGQRSVSRTYTLGSWILLSSRHNGTTLDLGINSGTLASTFLTTRTGLNGVVWLGRSANQLNHFNGDLGEVVTYGVALSDDHRADVISYLTSKWGIT